jgi:spore maturation protein CgeB
MKLVIFGLTVSSSWGNGHATLWRGLIRALGRRGHRVLFYEKDVPYYAENRDLGVLDGGQLRLYPDWESVRAEAAQELRDADAAIVTSYCPDGVAATDLVLDSRCLRVFYDLDTPVTLARLGRGEQVAYIHSKGLAGFDLVLSYTGGAALDALKARLGARRVAPLYGSVDPDSHRPAPPQQHYRSDLSFLGTYAEDRQAALETLFIEPARRRPDRRFLIGGAMYPTSFPWVDNIFFVRHLPPSEHPAFYSSSRMTLNITRREMAEMGFCPSGRLFEAASAGVPILSDWFDGLDQFFRPGEEILIAEDSEAALDAIDLGDGILAGLATAARERTLAEHTATRRAEQLESLLDAAMAPAASAWRS